MLTGNREMLLRECDRRNYIERRVCDGKIDSRSFFRNVRGDLLLSGYGAGSRTMVTELICQYMRRRDLPTVVLSGHADLFRALGEKQARGEIARVMLSWPGSRNYHPFYGMTKQQMLRLLRMTAEEMGCGGMTGQIMAYASALLDVVSVAYPVSLPAVVTLLWRSDDEISDYALRSGLSGETADSIRGNSEAGVSLRRVCERLEDIFGDVSAEGAETKNNIQSGAMGNVAIMAFYSMGNSQSILNSYLKEELHSALRRVSRLRVVLDDTVFVSGEDELLRYLLDMKRMGRIELVLISTNAREAVWGTRLNFANVVLFPHDDPMVTEELSRDCWGSYPYSYPVPGPGKPPAAFGWTIKTDMHWHIATEEHLRVRSADLHERRRGLFGGSDRLAVKTAADDNIYLIKASVFLPAETGEMMRLNPGRMG